MPVDLKPRVFRSTINSIRCRDGRVVAVEIKGVENGVLPEKWTNISNFLGATYGITCDDKGNSKPTKLLEGVSPFLKDPGFEPVNWRGLLEFDFAAA